MDLINTDSFKVRVEGLLEQWHVPGLSIAVFNEKDLSAAAFGFATLEPPTPATPDTIYDMASTSKSLTAAAVGKLVSDETFDPRVEWDTPMSRLLPGDFVLQDEYASEHATIEDILSHRTGMPRHDDSPMGVGAPVPDTPQSVTRNLRNLAATAPFRVKYQYCNLMYTVATYLVEKLSNMKFAQFLQQHIFDVLGMSSSYLQPSAVYAAGQGHRLATRYIWDSKESKYKALKPVEQPEAQGAGSIQSTVLDYSKWVRAMMTKDERLFPEEVYKELTKPRMICEPEEDESSLEPFTSHKLYALGWETRSYRGHQIVGHDGAIIGFGSMMLYIPEINFGLVMIGNGDDAGSIANILSMEIIDHVLGVVAPDRVDWSQREDDKAKKAEDEVETPEKLREEICPEGGQPLKLALELYTGTYENVGYHQLTIDVQNGQLHVNGLARSEPIEIFFEHVCENTKFIATIVEDAPDLTYMKCEFRISDTDEVEAVGIAFCEENEDDPLIWFKKMKA